MSEVGFCLEFIATSMDTLIERRNQEQPGNEPKYTHAYKFLCVYMYGQWVVRFSFSAILLLMLLMVYAFKFSLNMRCKLFLVISGKTEGM